MDASWLGITFFLLTGWSATSYAQFPSYFNSQQNTNSLLPPNCFCQQQASSGSTAPFQNQTPNNQYPVNPYPVQPVNPFPNNQNQNPSYQYPVNPYPNQPVNPFPNSPNFPVNPFPNNNVPANGLPPAVSGNVDRGQQGFGQRHFGSYNTAGYGATANNYRICGTDGQTYPDVCQFINAQYANPALGGRPCDIAAAIQAVNSGSAVSRQDTGPVCLNSGVASSSANFALGVMSTSPGTGIRCEGLCPCQLKCPLTQGSFQGGSTFNHWSFGHGGSGNAMQNHGHHGYGRPHG